MNQRVIDSVDYVAFEAGKQYVLNSLATFMAYRFPHYCRQWYLAPSQAAKHEIFIDMMTAFLDKMEEPRVR